VPLLSLDAASAAFARLERSVAGGGWSASTRFNVVKAAAALLPEGCVLELHPNHDAVLPRHGILVNMSVGSPTGRGFAVPADPEAAGGRPIELLLPGPASYDVDAGVALVRPRASVIDFGLAANPRAKEYDENRLSRLTIGALHPSMHTYDAVNAWLAHIITSAKRPPAFNFGLSAGRGSYDAASRALGRPLGEGEMLILEVGRESGRPMHHDGAGGAIAMGRQVGRAQLHATLEHSTGPISGGDYDVDDRPTRYRWPVVDFGSGPGRPASVFGNGGEGGDLLDLDIELAQGFVEPRVRVVDFSRVEGHTDPAADASSAPCEGQLLDLNPNAEVTMPSHPTLVAMRRDPNRPRVRRQPVVRGGDGAILVDIEQALAATETA